MYDEFSRMLDFMVNLAISAVIGIICAGTIRIFTEYGITIGIGVGFILLVILTIISEIKGRKLKRDSGK